MFHIVNNIDLAMQSCFGIAESDVEFLVATIYSLLDTITKSCSFRRNNKSN